MKRCFTLIVISIFCGFEIIAQTGPHIKHALEYMLSGKFELCMAELANLEKVSDVNAYYVLGQCYQKGYILQCDSQKAFNYYRKAAERGLAIAQKSLADLYVNKGDFDKAHYWELKADGNYRQEDLTLIDRIYAEGIKNSNHRESLSDINSIQYSDCNPYIGPVNEATSNDSERYSHIAAEVSSKTVSPVVSDVDINIPRSLAIRESTFAIIIANENYDELQNVPYAHNDADILKKYFESSFGIPTNNIHLLKDATLGNIKRQVSWISDVANLYPEEAQLIFYYAGHGYPADKSRTPMLVPVDGFISDETTCIKLSDLYEKIGKLPLKNVTIILDACFSGAGRGDEMLSSTRGIAIKPSAVDSVIGDKTVILTASQGNESAYPYNEKQHGLFTYHVLKYIQKSGGKVLLGDLFDYVKSCVTRTSIVTNGKLQTPCVLLPKQLTEWRNLPL